MDTTNRRPLAPLATWLGIAAMIFILILAPDWSAGVINAFADVIAGTFESAMSAMEPKTPNG